MRYPAAMFQGVKTQYNCDPLSCEKRGAYVTAAQTAIAMINDQLGRHNLCLSDRAETLMAKAPYFTLDHHLPKQARATQYTATVQTPPTAPGDIVTLAATITALDSTVHEELAYIEVLFSDCTCLHLGVELCADPVIDGTALTFQVHAYDLIDLDNVPDDGMPADSIPYLSTVKIKLHTRIDSLPRYMWQIWPCSPTPTDPCTYYATAGCLIERRFDIYDVLPGPTTTPCPPLGKIDHYELDAINVGVWRQTLADAVVSLMNCRLPMDYCNCDPISNLRYKDDNGLSDRFAKVYPYSFYNPFGILAPGAQYAWKSIETLINNTEVFRS